MLKVTLKKPWRSPRGRLYPEGTTFKLTQKIHTTDELGAWYDFVIPNKAYGIVYFPDKVHRALTEEELRLRKSRAALRAKHFSSAER